VVRAEFFSRYATACRPNESLSLRLQMAEVRQGQSQAGNAEGAVGCIESIEAGAREAESN
jgi:hypothetical protein